MTSEKSFFHRVKQTSTETLNQLIEREGVDATLIDANLSPWSFLHCLRLSALRGLAVVSQLSANSQQRLKTVKMTLCALINEEAGSLQCYSLEEISSFVISQLQAKLQISAVVPLNNEIITIAIFCITCASIFFNLNLSFPTDQAMLEPRTTQFYSKTNN